MPLLLDEKKKEAMDKAVDDKSPSVFVKQYIGFVAGIASGVTKLLVGHPFGESL